MTPFVSSKMPLVMFAAGVAAKAGGGPIKNAKHILVVTDAGVKGAGLLDGIFKALGDRVCLVADGVVADGDVRYVEQLAAQAKALNVDAIVAVGGGSVIDSAKAMAAVMATGKRLAELDGIATVRATTVPLVAVPTTAGTGSEATQFLVIKDHETQRKISVLDGALVPVQTYLDPTLLVGLPRAVTAATGVDAITHALEALASTAKNPIGTAVALEALRLLVAERALERALAEPSDVAARGDCLVAAHLAGQAISQSMLGACHALAHALGATSGVAHGVANGLFLLPTLRLNADVAKAAYARAAAACGVDGFAALVQRLDAVVHEAAGIPRTLSGLGVGQADVALLATRAFADRSHVTNPVPVTVERFEQLLVEIAGT